MDEYTFLIPIAIALFIGVVTPGPSFLLVAQTSLDKSRLHGIATSLGMGVGSVIFALVASYGLFIVLKTIPSLYAALKLIGGIYLCYLALKIWFQANDNISAFNSISNDRNLYKSFVVGFFTQLSNPKTAIVFGGVFMAFLPAKIPENSVLLLSVIAFLIDAGWYVVVSFLLTTKKSQRFYLRFKRKINRTASGLLGIMGVKLAFNQ